MLNVCFHENYSRTLKKLFSSCKKTRENASLQYNVPQKTVVRKNQLGHSWDFKRLLKQKLSKNQSWDHLVNFHVFL